MESSSTLEDSGVNRKEIFSKAESPSALIEIIGMDDKFKDLALAMSEAYENISENLTALEYSDLINIAPEKDGIRGVWEELLNRELIFSSDSIESFLKNLSLIPNVPSTLGDKPGSFYSDSINRVMSSFGGEDSTGLKSSKMFGIIQKLPRAFGIREKAKEFF